MLVLFIVLFYLTFLIFVMDIIHRQVHKLSSVKKSELQNNLLKSHFAKKRDTNASQSVGDYKVK